MVHYNIIKYNEYTILKFKDYCKKKCILENNYSDNCIKNCEYLLVDFFKTVNSK